MRKLSVLLMLFVLFAHKQSIAGGDGPLSPKPITIGQTIQIQSKALGETRSLNVYLPEGYNANADSTYPVIYLLDGGMDEDFLHICGIVQFLNGIVDTMAKCIVVGICNIDRKRDMTFPTSIEKDKKAYPTTGGSSKFIEFIEKDLQPYIRKAYRVKDSKTLIGQSLGGLVATEILLKKPELFNNYLIVSPSLWWDDESLLVKAPELIKAQADNKRHVFIAVGTEGEQMEGDAKKLATLLQASGKKNLKTELVSLPAENHLTILHNAAYNGLEALFAH